MLHRTRSVACLARALMLLPLLAAASRAVTVEQVVNPKSAYDGWVSDMANILDADSEALINERIDSLKAQQGGEIAVVTVPSIEGAGTPKDFATELFNRWGIGQAGADNGVLILRVVEPKRLEVETGYGVEGVLPDGKVGAMIDQLVAPEFAAGDWGDGLFELVDAIATTMEGGEVEGLAGVSGAVGATGAGDDVGAPSGGSPLPWILGFVGGGVLLGGGAMAWARRPRKCPQCRTKMELIDEQKDDLHLDEAQRFEEKLGSVDYRVYRCPDCGELRTERAAKWSSDYQDCPRCNHRTLHVESRTLRAPTYTSEGLREVRKNCEWRDCHYRDTDTERVPRLQRTTSSSGSSFGGSSGGGSFGGGSSGGGGAGRSI